MKFFIFSLFLALFSFAYGVGLKECYDNADRCLPSAEFATGILWKSCPEYCQKCLGRESGACERVFNKECSGGYQCHCNGGNVPKTDSWVEQQTCKLGL